MTVARTTLTSLVLEKKNKFVFVCFLYNSAIIESGTCLEPKVGSGLVGSLQVSFRNLNDNDEPNNLRFYLLRGQGKRLLQRLELPLKRLA